VLIDDLKTEEMDMDILDKAIEFEYKGHEFFKEKAAQAKTPAVKQILENLAQDEIEHAKFLEGLKSGETRTFNPSTSMRNIKSILEESKVNEINFLEDEPDVLEVLNAALELEARAANLYSKEALATQDPEIQDLLKQLEFEENSHHALIQNLIKYLDGPFNLLETQEFQRYDD